VPQFWDGMTLGQARDELRKLVDEGHRCPCCTQYAKVYKRKIHAGMAATLIRVYKRGIMLKDGFVYLPDIPQKSRDFAGVAYWGLAEEEKTVLGDDGRSGYWRVTDLGEAFVLRRIPVKTYAHVYDGRCLKLSGDEVWVRDSLGVRFDYDELMAL
jgi:hypothetical protein